MVDHRKSLRKYSHQKREERIAGGNLDPELDYFCETCNGVFSRYYGRHKLHLRKCQLRMAQPTRSSRKPPLPPPPPFENEIFHSPLETGAQDVDMDETCPTANPGRPAEPLSAPPGDTDIGCGPSPVEVALRPGETLIVSHPHSRCPMRVVPTAELHGPHEQVIGRDIKTSKASYAPFPSRADFEQAELFVNSNCSNKYIDAQLKLARQNGMAIAMKTSREMHNLLARGVEDDITDDYKFRQEEISVPYVQGNFNELRTYTIRYRPAMEAILRVVEDPDLRGVFNMYPQQHYVRNPSGGPNMRVWTDVHTADDWWALQDKVGSDKVVIHVRLYSDATQLNRVGTRKWWGVYMYIGNIPQELWVSRGRKGSAVLLGQVPDVPGKSADTDSALANHRAQVYHATLLKILESATIAAGETGFTFNDGQRNRLAQLIIAILSGDYEEYTRLASILGTQSEFKCPVCLVPADALWNLCGAAFPQRTRNKTLTLIENADEQTSATAARKVLAAQSIRGISNTILDYFSIYISLYRMFCADPLHQIEQGIWGKHFWLWFKSNYLTRSELDELDASFTKIPPISKLHHFPNGVCRLKYITAREQGIVLRYLAPLAHGVRESEGSQDMLIIPAIRHLACLLLLSRFHAHTTSTLSLLEKHIHEFGGLTKTIRESPTLFDHHEELSFSWPKMHSITHLIECIRAKGAVQNYSSDSGEALHPQSHKDWGRTNQQATAPDQMLRMAFEREVVMAIRYRVDSYDEQRLLNETLWTNNTTVVSRSHIRLGALGKTIHLGSYARVLRKDIGLQDLQGLLVKVLRSRNIDVGPHYISHFRVVPCHALWVTYDCQETAVKKVDLLHVTTSWRRSGPRYDHAILQGSRPSEVMFCQVFAIFMVLVAQEWYRLAVVKIYERKRRNKLTGHIELATPRDGHLDLCFIESFVRIAHVLPPMSHNPRSVVQDLYDGDMYLRLYNVR